LPLAVGAGLYFGLAYRWELFWATLVSWTLYYTIVGVVASFIIDGAGPAAGSLFLLLVLAFVSLVHKMYMSLPFNAAYAIEYYLVTDAISRVHQQQGLTLTPRSIK